MRLADFKFHLPKELIAHYPQSERSACRLLKLEGESGSIEHGKFTDLLTLLSPGDLLVFNDTRVIPARIYGRKSSGGKIELLIERVVDNHRVLAHIRASKSPKPGSKLLLGDNENIAAQVIKRHDALFEIWFDAPQPVLEILNQIGHMPLPPYIDRPDDQADRECYQTVYSQKPGAVAAPTAGLHFDEPLIQALKKKGIETAFVTLHVGAGTFQPVRVANIEEHKMHAELAEVSQSVVDAVLACKARGNKVVAVGTTSVRSLESAAQAAHSELIAPFFADTTIFIYPSYQYKVVDSLITNFHLPESTLIMLVSAFAGYNNTLLAYQSAIEHRYRFFSYGDAMYITKNPHAMTEKIGMGNDK